MKTTAEEAETFVEDLVAEWGETPPLRGVIVEIVVKTREGDKLASGSVRLGDPRGR